MSLRPLARLLVLVASLAAGPLAPAPVLAQTAAQTAPAALDPVADANADPDALGAAFDLLPTFGAEGEEDFELPIQLLLLLTILSLAPSIIILMTSFTRLVIVFSILRTALGTQQSPPTQVIIGLSLFLTIFIMHPVLETIHDDALQPYIAGEMTQRVALENAARPMRAFMLNQTREKDLLLFMDLSGQDVYADVKDVPLHVLVPAFVISELRIAFQIGFMIFLPFLIVDMIVASVLMSMGMMMLPPVMISLPVKLLLFVLTDGWYLIVESVVKGYAV